MRIVWLTLIAALSACATTTKDPFVSHVDERTGQTVVYAQQPLRFAAKRLGLSQVGKDYLVVTPLRANLEGSNRDFLFFAIGSSIDRELVDASAPVVRRVILRADEQLMSFETSQWSELSTQAPFSMNLIVHDMLVANVTQSEMAFIAQAGSVSAWLLSADSRSPEFELQSGDSKAWANF